MRLTWRPAAAATAAGAAESHSYMPPCVRVDVGLAHHHRHGLGAGRTETHDVGAEHLRRDDRRRAASGTGWSRSAGRRPSERPAPAAAAGRWRRCGPPQAGATAAGDRLALDHERHVHRPVGPPGFAELVRAVEGVDDPDPVRRSAGCSISTLLGEDGVVRAGLLAARAPGSGGRRRRPSSITCHGWAPNAKASARSSTSSSPASVASRAASAWSSSISSSAHYDRGGRRRARANASVGLVGAGRRPGRRCDAPPARPRSRRRCSPRRPPLDGRGDRQQHDGGHRRDEARRDHHAHCCCRRSTPRSSRRCRRRTDEGTDDAEAFSVTAP